MVEGSSIADRMVKTNFGDRVAPAPPEDDPGIRSAFQMVGKKIHRN